VTYKTLNAMWLDLVPRYADQPIAHCRQSQTIKTPDGRIDEEVRFIPVSYREADELVRDFGLGLLALGLQAQEGAALIAENSLRWLVCDFAILANRAYDVPRGCSCASKELAYILGHSKARFAILEDEAQLERVLALQSGLPELKVLIVLSEGFKGRPGVHSFEQVLALGKEAGRAQDKALLFHRRRQETAPSDLATILYTSGSSGTPKGVPLTHMNLLHSPEKIPPMLGARPGQGFLAILPIWHSFERMIEYCALHSGGSIYYSTPATAFKDLSLVNPQYMAGVPRLWLAVYNTARTTLRLAGKEKLFLSLYRHSLAVMRARRCRQGRQYLTGNEEPVPARATLWDRLCHDLADLLIYRKIRAKFGLKFITLISGGGSLPAHVDDFFEIIGISIIDGYGLTETSPTLSVRMLDHNIRYTCGRPLPETEVQIRDKDGRILPIGEKGLIWARGPQVMSGYYHNDEETRKVLQPDGQGRVWFNTGDLGLLTRSGDLSVLGREKDTIVLIGGENIEPEPIEGLLTSTQYIDQAMLCGQDQEYVTALIVPEKKHLRELCISFGLAYSEEKTLELAQDPKLRRFYADLIAKAVSLEAGFREADRIVNFTFTRPFTAKDDTLTLTHKVKRHKVLERDADLIRALYPRYTDVGKKL
jgi:long-chain acyl-CoA synthetase